MDNQKQVNKFIRDFQKYRKMQDKLTKLKSKPAGRANVVPVTEMLKQINWHLTDMDKAAIQILNPTQEEKNETVR